MKFLLELFCIIILKQSIRALECNDISQNLREECGYKGIIQSECIARKCCFDIGVEAGVIQCYYPKGNSYVCKTHCNLTHERIFSVPFANCVTALPIEINTQVEPGSNCEGQFTSEVISIHYWGFSVLIRREPIENPCTYLKVSWSAIYNKCPANGFVYDSTCIIELNNTEYVDFPTAKTFCKNRGFEMVEITSQKMYQDFYNFVSRTWSMTAKNEIWIWLGNSINLDGTDGYGIRTQSGEKVEIEKSLWWYGYPNYQNKTYTAIQFGVPYAKVEERRQGIYNWPPTGTSYKYYPVCQYSV